MRSLLTTLLLLLLVSAVPGSALCVSDLQQQGETSVQAMTVAQLEKAGDDCRVQKDYAEAIKYFNEALRKDRSNAKLYNKRGLAHLSLGDYNAARYDFSKATRYNRKYPEAWNDLGVVSYLDRNYKGATEYFKKAIALDETRASFHVNLGITWFARDQMDRSMREYVRALELDPEALRRSSSVGMSAQIVDRQERAKHQYMLAKVYAQLGNVDSCLVCLQNAKEEGYGDLSRVYKEEEFSKVRQDPRLASIVPPPQAN